MRGKTTVGKKESLLPVPPKEEGLASAFQRTQVLI
jgi:hypothetical protein